MKRVQRSARSLWGKVVFSAALVPTLALAGCSHSNSIQADPSASSFGVIKISKGLSTETETVAYIYAKALEKAGYQVEVVDTGHTREDYLKAMEDPADSKTPSASPTAEKTVANTDTVDVTPDYSGSLLYYLTDDGAFSTSYLEQQRSPSASPTPTETIDTTKTPDPSLLTSSPEETALNAKAMSSSDILDSVNRLVPEGLTLLSASDGQNRDELVVTAATAAKYQLRTIDDLAKYCGKLNFGVPSEFQNRPYGAKALAQYYQCKPQKFTVIDDQDKLSDALASNQVQVANVFSASSTIDQNAYKVLEDPSGIFIPQQIVPVVRDNELPDSAKNAINTVSTQISTDDLKNFDNLTHGSEAMSPSDVATFWIDHSTE